jgi:hypothetical protein
MHDVMHIDMCASLGKETQTHFDPYLEESRNNVAYDSNRNQHRDVLVQPEMEKRRSPLVSITPFGRDLEGSGRS